MRNLRWVGALLLGGLWVVGALALLGQLAPVSLSLAEVERVTGAPLDPTGPYTTHLPLVMRNHDPAYQYPFGITIYGSVAPGHALTAMREAGAYWITTFLRWSAIEPTPGSYNWSSFDSKAQAAQAAGAELFVLFTGNPAWAAQYAGGPVTDTQTLVSFVTLLAERYDGDGIDDAPGSPVVRYWSFYAEPDNGDPGRAAWGKGYWGYNGAGYAAMLAQVSPAMHAANPGARVLIGGVAYDWFVEEGGPYVRSFLTDTLKALATYPGGASRYIDSVAFHFYPIAPHRWPTIRHKAIEVRAIMQNHGVGTLPLLAPEMGYWSSSKWGSTPQNQANRLVQMYAQTLSMRMPLVSWYFVYDTVVAGSAEDVAGDRTCGLFDYYGTPKPAYFAYQTLTRELTGARYVRSVSRADIEGYVFKLLDQREVTVFWPTALPQGYVTLVFPYPCVRRVEVDGTVYAPIVDGDPNWDWDKTVNGQIVLAAHELNRPIYVRPCP